MSETKDASSENSRSKTKLARSVRGGCKVTMELREAQNLQPSGLFGLDNLTRLRGADEMFEGASEIRELPISFEFGERLIDQLLVWHTKTPQPKRILKD